MTEQGEFRGFLALLLFLRNMQCMLYIVIFPWLSNSSNLVVVAKQTTEVNVIIFLMLLH